MGLLESRLGRRRIVSRAADADVEVDQIGLSAGIHSVSIRAVRG